MARTAEARTETRFTPESANRALLYVRGVVEDMVQACRRLRRAEEARARALAGSPAAGATDRDRAETLRQAEADRGACREELDRIARELGAVGVQVKDPALGLVDFPGDIDGRRVLLCWKHGEGSVAWWHEVDAGFAGRRPIGPADPA